MINFYGEFLFEDFITLVSFDDVIDKIDLITVPSSVE